jgi:hypothetical protein
MADVACVLVVDDGSTAALRLPDVRLTRPRPVGRPLDAQDKS